MADVPSACERYVLSGLHPPGARTHLDASLWCVVRISRQDFERALQQLEHLKRDIALLEARISALEPSQRH